MKKLGIFLTAIVLASGLLAQDFSANNQSSKDKRARLKEQRNAEIAMEYAATSNMLDSMSFVLEAYNLRDEWGHLVTVPSNLNFIMVDSTKSVIQIGSNTRLGANGVGGVTAKGTVSNWKLIKEEKHKSFTLFMTVSTPIGIYDVSMFINADGNVTATISGINPGKLIYEGALVPLANSRVFEGQSI